MLIQCVLLTVVLHSNIHRWWTWKYDRGTTKWIKKIGGEVLVQVLVGTPLVMALPLIHHVCPHPLRFCAPPKRVYIQMSFLLTECSSNSFPKIKVNRELRRHGVLKCQLQHNPQCVCARTQHQPTPPLCFPINAMHKGSISKQHDWKKNCFPPVPPG